MKVLRLPICRALLAALLLPAASAQAGEHEQPWETVVRDRERVVEIDRSSVIQSDGGSKVAWGRIVLSPERAAVEGYASVKALNRYDCYNRSFFTVKRVYMDARHVVVREEGGLDESPVLAARNSVDERMWQEVCRPPTTSELQKIARDVTRIVEAARLEPAAEIPMVPPPRSVAATPPSSGKASSKTKDKGKVVDAAPVKSPVEPTVAVATLAPVSAAAPVPKSAPSSAAATKAVAASAGTGVRYGEPLWTYEGEAGPANWGKLRPEWAVCAEGKRQSPIDLRNGVAVDLEALRVDYRETHFRIADTGRTLRVHVGPGMGVEIRGQRYELDFFEFHRPSVERVGGQASDMVVHFHHRDPGGNIAIVAVLMEAGEPAHPLVQTLWNNLPLERGTDYMPAVTIDPASLLPASSAHYLFMGSLEAPPCTEGVLWAVMKEPLYLSAEQLGVFARLYARNGRPIQPHHGRLILESR